MPGKRRTLKTGNSRGRRRCVKNTRALPRVGSFFFLQITIAVKRLTTAFITGVPRIKSNENDVSFISLPVIMIA